MIDEEETMITAAMKHTETAEAARRHGRSEAEEEAAQEEAAHGHAAEHPELAHDPSVYIYNSIRTYSTEIATHSHILYSPN